MASIAHTPTGSPGLPDASEGDLNVTPERERFASRAIDPVTRERLEADERFFLRQALSTPCVEHVARAEGPFLHTSSGRRIYDFHGNAAHQLGHGHPEVVEALKRQMDELPFCPRRYANEPATRLAAKLAEITPGELGKTLLVPGGSSAIGVALKLARLATGRHKTISFWGAFHGAGLDAAAVGGEAMFREGLGPLAPGAIHVFPPAGGPQPSPAPDPQPKPDPCPYRCGGNCTGACINTIELVLEQERDVAAVIAEPMRAADPRPFPESYWRRVREACDRHGALLIFDEIPTALGRTGRMFACEHEGVVPDILVLGKGLGGGVMPQAAVVAHPRLDVAPDRAVGHYTHEKSPLGAAVALATINVIERDGLAQRAAELGDRIRLAVAAWRGSLPHVGGIRGRGLLLGLEVIDPASGLPDAASAEQAMYLAIERGLSFKLGGGSTIVLCPPLTITDDQLDEALSILRGCFSALADRA